MVSHKEARRVCVWLVALAGTKLAKENEPEENPLGFSEYTTTTAINYTRCCAFVFFIANYGMISNRLIVPLIYPKPVLIYQVGLKHFRYIC